MADSAAINSPDYWNQRFAVDWTARGGAEQTSFFAQVAIAMLPDWFWEDARKNTLSFVDVGCALGEALPDFRARLPRSKLVGVDVSKVAIRMARERLPDFTFRTVKEDWSDAPRAGVMYCSNTLEHLKDWRKRLTQLSDLADNYVLMLVPFQEKTLIDEHVVRFDFTSFPASLPDGKRLLYFRVLDAAQAPNTHWPGHQALAIYGAKVSAKDVHVETSHDPYAGADFRGRTTPQVKAALLALQAGYPPSDVQNPAAGQDIVDRINAEWALKLQTSTAEMSAKHAELRAHYERVLGERDARITQLSELQAWRQRAQDLEKALHENLTQQIKRGEEQAKALGEQLFQARINIERLKLEAAQAQSKIQTLVDGQKVRFERESELNAKLAERVQEMATLTVELERATADQAALKAAICSAVDERDQALAEQGRLASEYAQALEAEVAQAREAAQAVAEASRAEFDRAMGESAVAHATAMQRFADQHSATMHELVAALDPELDALRRSWQVDYTRLSNRTALLEQHNADLRTQLLRILASKSLKLGTSLRRVYWTLLGQPGAPAEIAPSAPPAPADAGSEFLRAWDGAKRVIDAAHFAASAQPPVAPLVIQAPLSPTPVALPPPPLVAEAPPPPEPVATSPPVVVEALSPVAPAPPENLQGPPRPAPVARPQQRARPVFRTPAPQLAPLGPIVAPPVNDGPRVIALQAVSLGSGGLERVVFDLAVGLKARGETVIAIVTADGGMFADDLRQRGIAVHEINRDLASYERVLRENAVTDLFMHHAYFGFERAASLGLRLYDVVHNYYFWHRNSGKMIRRVADLCTRVIYVSAAVRVFHERLFGVSTSKAVVINNPVHLDGLIVPEKAQLQRLREKSAETIFLNVAQAFPSKAQPAMITAFARALRKNKNLRLQIAGGPVKDDAARAVRARIDAEGVSEAVELLGHCDRRRMSRLYAEAHAFVLPSLYEGYSVSAIEAATYGLPLILTNVGGAEDLITHSGCGILLPTATDDLSQFDALAVERLGLASENAATPALEKAFIALAAERPQWTSRALEARYDIRSLDEAIEAYVSTMPAITRAEG